MISDFEQHLANVLGSRLPAPFAGRVEVAPGPVTGPGPEILLGVQQIEPAHADIGSQRPETVPGSDDRRRVMRLRCTIGIEVRPHSGQGRQQQMQGVEAALYVLDAQDLRDGSALVEEDDQGFLIQEMHVVESQVCLDPDKTGAPPVGLTLNAEGWFWPIGEPGETGIQIGEVRLRGAILPLSITPPRPYLTAGGAGVKLTLRVGTVGPLRTSDQVEPLPPLPFGSLALTLVDPGGRPGAGTLSGGTAGEGDAHLVALSDGGASVTYIPPAEATIEVLTVALDDGQDGPGIELGQFTLDVQEA
jgi:hypothetical protein